MIVSKKKKIGAQVQVDIHSEIVERCRRGDHKAQYRLYKLYAAAMFNICLRMMNSREEAEDMLQEAFADAFRRLNSFRYESSFGSWLKRIVINHCINELKRRKANLEFFEDMGNYDGKSDEEESGYEQGLSVEKVKEAMKALPEGSRMIFSLYLLEGYDHREIAQILNTSESNSKSQYMRAKRRVREILKENIYETG